jgi:hypothetical protein
MTDLLEAHTLLCLSCKAHGSYSPLVMKYDPTQYGFISSRDTTLAKIYITVAEAVSVRCEENLRGRSEYP